MEADEVQGRRPHRDKSIFYMECRNVLLSQKDRISDTQALSQKALYQELLGVPEFISLRIQALRNTIFATFLLVVSSWNEPMSKRYLWFCDRPSDLTGNSTQQGCRFRPCACDAMISRSALYILSFTAVSYSHSMVTWTERYLPKKPVPSVSMW